jgi:hypothetical protein
MRNYIRYVLDKSYPPRGIRYTLIPITLSPRLARVTGSITVSRGKHVNDFGIPLDVEWH